MNIKSSWDFLSSQFASVQARWSWLGQRGGQWRGLRERPEQWSTGHSLVTTSHTRHRLHDNFAVLFQRSFGLGQVIWYPGWRVILYRVTMPEAPPSVGSAIVAQSVGRNNDPVVPGWRLCQDINSLVLQEGFLRTPVSWSIRSVYLYLRNKWSSYVCVTAFSQKPALIIIA